eukprot:TRINITY_DN546_c0_g5_i2.p1 TRINITY_DN546_c0_g5~~TRINITY_DN546_c0_g5_i2.p1  ORF type:complete len:571 (+),score=185.52 TRINITY_DN546_c0_g5_i2:106-1818(+)
MNKAKVVLERHPKFANDVVGSVTFFPDFNTFSVEDALKSLRKAKFWSEDLNLASFSEDLTAARSEFIFIIDRSGSMMGDRIASLKESMRSLIDMLPSQSYFNVINFGSSYDFMFPDSLIADQSNKDKALAKIDSVDADYGGTEILQPVQEAIRLKRIDGMPRVVFVLTDGDVSNGKQIISTIQKNAKDVRFYSIGIGNGISPYLIKGIARAGKGTFELVKDNSNLRIKAKRMLENSISPFLKNFKISFSHPNIIKKVHPDPEHMPFILKNEIFRMYFELNAEAFTTLNTDLSIHITFENSKTNKEENFIVKITPDNQRIMTAEMLHQLYAADLISNYERDDDSNADEMKKSIVLLSTKYQVLSSETAFICVVKKFTVEPGQDPFKINIPSIESKDYENSTDAYRTGDGGDMMMESMAFDMSALPSNTTMSKSAVPRGAPVPYTPVPPPSPSSNPIQDDANRESYNSAAQGLVLRLYLFIIVCFICAFNFFRFQAEILPFKSSISVVCQGKLQVDEQSLLILRLHCKQFTTLQIREKLHTRHWSSIFRHHAIRDHECMLALTKCSASSLIG